jgi:hypothetical protein
VEVPAISSTGATRGSGNRDQREFHSFEVGCPSDVH